MQSHPLRMALQIELFYVHALKLTRACACSFLPSFLMAEYSSHMCTVVQTNADTSFTGSTDCTWHCMIFNLKCIALYTQMMYTYIPQWPTHNKRTYKVLPGHN